MADDVIDRCVAAHGDRLYNLALSLADGRADAEDLLQTLWERVHRVAGRHRDDGDWPSYAYLRTALVNAHVSDIRRRIRGRRHLTAVDRPESYDDLVTDRLHLQGLLGALPQRQRQAVVLRYLEDLPVAEVATLLRVSTGTVKSNAHDGLKAIRAAMAAEEREGAAHE